MSEQEEDQVSRPSMLMQREASVGLDEDGGNTTDGIAGYEPEDDDADSNLPPGRMHATNSLSDIRLKGAHMSLPTFSVSHGHGRDHGGHGSGDSVASNSSGGSVTKHHGHRSMELLPNPTPSSPRSLGKSTKPSTHDGNSSISSLEDFVDTDILYDRAGFADQDKDASSIKSKEAKEKSQSFNNLPPVHERLSEDTLEDVHAFSDLKAPTHTSSGGGSTTSRANSITTAENDKLLLDPLVEEEEDDENDDGIANDLDEPQPGAVILTNLEKLSLQANSNSGHNNAGTASSAMGDDSLAVGAVSMLGDLSEAPSQT